MSGRKTFCDSITLSFKTKVQYVTGYVANHKSWVVQVLAYLGGTAAVAGIVGKHINAQYDDTAYAVARASGAAIRYVFVPSLVPFVMRHSMSFVQSTYVSKFLGFEQRITSHRAIATLLGFAGFVHTIGHAVADPQNFLTRPGITGYLLWGAYLGPILGMFLLRKNNKVKNAISYGTQVLRPHQVGAIAFLAAFSVHRFNLELVPYAAVVGGAYLVDKSWFKIFYQHDAILRRRDIVKNTDYVLLEIERPFNFKPAMPGSSALLSLPGLDKFLEYPHPFTIVNDDGSKLEFLIKRDGVWTQKLYNLIQTGQMPESLALTVAGPISSKLSSIYKKPLLTILGFGVGITPYISFINWLINKNANSPKINLYISQKTLDELMIVIELLMRVFSRNMKFIESVDLYATQEILELSSNQLKNPKILARQAETKIKLKSLRDTYDLPFVVISDAKMTGSRLDQLSIAEPRGLEKVVVKMPHEKVTPYFFKKEHAKSQDRGEISIELEPRLLHEMEKMKTLSSDSSPVQTTGQIPDLQDVPLHDEVEFKTPVVIDDYARESSGNNLPRKNLAFAGGAHRFFAINLHLNHRPDLEKIVSESDKEITISANSDVVSKAKRIAYRFNKSVSVEVFG